jgi:stage V sporulation protein SpoVS
MAAVRRFAATGAAASGGTPVPTLPLDMLRERLFTLLPADARGRASCVCRLWRDAAADPALWATLDISRAGGTWLQLRRAPLLLGASRRAAGALVDLDVSGILPAARRFETLLDVVRANGASLRTLRTFVDVSVERRQLEALLAAAPHLATLRVDGGLHGDAVKLLPFLQRQLPNAHPAVLHFDDLYASMPSYMVEEFVVDVQVVALARALRGRSLSTLTLAGEWADVAHTQAIGRAAFDELVDVVLECRVSRMIFSNAGLTRVCVPALVRLLAEDSEIRELTVNNMGNNRLLNEAAALQLSTAMRNNTTLHRFDVSAIRMGVATATVMLTAAAGHRSLCALYIGVATRGDEDPELLRRFRIALHTLVVANAPSLQTLEITVDSDDDEDDPLDNSPHCVACRKAVVVALRSNTHLTVVECFRETLRG